MTERPYDILDEQWENLLRGEIKHLKKRLEKAEALLILTERIARQDGIQPRDSTALPMGLEKFNDETRKRRQRLTRG